MRTLEWEHLQDILIGAAFLGTGGGGSLDEGLKTVRADLRAGRALRLADPDELPPETWACTPYYCGSLAPSGKISFKAAAAPYDGQECLLAAKVLERHLGVAFGTTVATELGGGNTAAALSVAAQLGLPALDADGAKVKGNILLESGFSAQGVVRLVATKIGGDLACNGGTFSNPGKNALAADRAIVTGSIFLGNWTPDGPREALHRF